MLVTVRQRGYRFRQRFSPPKTRTMATGDRVVHAKREPLKIYLKSQFVISKLALQLCSDGENEVAPKHVIDSALIQEVGRAQ